MIFNALAVFFFGLTAGMFFWLHAYVKDYSVHSYAVSDFIHTRHAKKFWLLLVFNACGYWCLSVSLFTSHLVFSLLFAISGVLSFLIAALPVNKIGTKRTAMAYGHIGVAGGFFTLVILLMFLIHQSLIPTFNFGLQIALGILAWLARIAVTVFIFFSLAPNGDKYYGIPQRSFIVLVFLWSLMFSIGLLVHQ